MKSFVYFREKGSALLSTEDYELISPLFPFGQINIKKQLNVLFSLISTQNISYLFMCKWFQCKYASSTNL